MSRILKALVKAGAVTVQDGRIVPTTNRTPRESAVVFHGEQLLLADGEGVKVFNTVPLGGFGGLLAGRGTDRDARVVRAFGGPRPDRHVALPSAHRTNTEGA